ncbi:MAG: Uma2 family endonuclease [Acidimicrobiales bacterium]
MVTRLTLPDEADDLTVSELHELVVNRLVDALRYIFAGAALVLSDIFVRVDDEDQVAPDVLIVPSARRGTRTVYRIPGEPVPAVTLEVLSPANYEAEGLRQLEHERSVLGRIGVPVHIELDPDHGILTVWRNAGGELVVGPPANRYEGPDLGGLRIELEPGDARLWMPVGRELVDAATEIARADAEAGRAEAETRRAEAETKRADAEARRADHLAEALRRAGIDPESG